MFKNGSLQDLEDWKKNIDEFYREETNKKWAMLEKGLSQKIQKFLSNMDIGYINSYRNTFLLRKMRDEDKEFRGYNFEWTILCMNETYILKVYYDKICLTRVTNDKNLYFQKYDKNGIVIEDKSSVYSFPQKGDKKKGVVWKSSPHQTTIYKYFDEELVKQALILINNFPKTKILTVYETYKRRCKKYPIIETREAIFCLLAIWKYRQSSLSIFPKDMIRLIGETLWKDRTKFFV